MLKLLINIIGEFMTKVRDKISTTQIAGAIAIALTLYNAFARVSNKPVYELSQDEMLAIAGIAAPVVAVLYMMYERTKKSVLKWGIFK